MHRLGWARQFDDPITLPDGRTLITLKQAAEYIIALPKKEHDALEWLAAMEALLRAAEDRGPLMHAHIGVLRGLNRDCQAGV